MENAEKKKRGRPSLKKEVKEEVKELKTSKKPKIRPKRDLDEQIKVTNITNSKLTYKSKNQYGYRIDWFEYGEENWIEYKELINMKNSQRSFFEQPWIICDWDVLEDLKVDKYYKNMIDLDNLDVLFKKAPEELKKILEIIPEGIKKLVIDRAFELRKEKKIDSINIIESIEKTLNVDLSV